MFALLAPIATLVNVEGFFPSLVDSLDAITSAPQGSGIFGM